MPLRSLDDGRSSPWRDRLSEPFVALGRNALVPFVLAGLFARSMLLLEVAAADGTAQSLQQWLYRTAFAGLAAPRAMVWVGPPF